jgi:hypothetical protein
VIFLSHRPNLDPEPYLNVHANTRQADNRDGWRSFAPRPEFEPTRDPEPWTCDPAYAKGYCRSIRRTVHHDAWSPRREQYDTPVNPILTDFRSVVDVLRHIPVPEHVEGALSVLHAWEGVASVEEIQQAEKVFSRWLKVFS